MPLPIEVVLVALSMAAPIITGRKLWQGWAMMAASCAGWGIYFAITHQWGAALLQVYNVSVGVRNVYIWYKAKNASKGRNPESHAAAVCACAAPEWRP